MKTLAVLLLASAVSAQSYFIPDNSPSGTSNVIPFGHSTTTSWENQKYQTMAAAADINNAAVLQITDLREFAACVAGQREPQYSFEHDLVVHEALLRSSGVSV